MKLNLIQDDQAVPMECEAGSDFYLQVHQAEVDHHRIEIRRVYFDRSGMDDFRYKAVITSPDGEQHHAGFGHRTAASALQDAARKLPDFTWNVSEAQEEDDRVPF